MIVLIMVSNPSGVRCSWTYLSKGGVRKSTSRRGDRDLLIVRGKGGETEKLAAGVTAGAADSEAVFSDSAPRHGVPNKLVGSTLGVPPPNGPNCPTLGGYSSRVKHMKIRPSVRSPVLPFVRPFVRPSVRPCVRPFVGPSVIVHLPFVHASART